MSIILVGFCDDTMITIAWILWQKHGIECEKLFYSTINILFNLIPGHSNLVHSVGKINEHIRGDWERYFFYIKQLRLKTFILVLKHSKDKYTRYH